MVNEHILNSGKYSVVEQNISMYDNVYEQMAMDSYPEEEDYASMEPREEDYISSLVTSEPKKEHNTESVETGPSTLSISSILDDAVAKKQEKEAVEQESLVFGLYDKYKRNIEQTNNGIGYSINVGDDDNPQYDYITLFDGKLTSISYHYDNLGLRDDYYKVGYFNNISQKELVFKGSMKEISKELEGISDYVIKTNDVNAVLSKFKNESIDKGLFETVPYYSIEGYFIHEDKVVDNNTYLLDKYSSISDVEIKRLFLDKLSLFHEYLLVLKDTYEDGRFTEIAKVILLMPFYYVFKQIGYQEPIKFIENYGTMKNGKTSNTVNLLSFYNPIDYRFSRAGTYASLRNEFNEFNTLPLLIDEAMLLLGNNKVQELLKDARYNIDIKGTANNDKQGDNKNYNAFKHYIFTTNKTNMVFDGLSRGLLTYKFNTNITDEQKKVFNSKFKRDMDFSIIGYVFSKYFIEYFNHNDFNTVFSYDPNEFINLILYKIEDDLAEEFGEQYNNCLEFLADVNPYEDINNELNYDYIDTCANKLQVDMFYHNQHIRDGDLKNLEGLCKTNPEYKIFRLSPNNDYFVVSQKKLEKLLMKKANGNVVSLEQLLDLRELSQVVKISNLRDLEITTGEVFYYTGDKTTFQGSLKVSPNSYILDEEVITKLFNI